MLPSRHGNPLPARERAGQVIRQITAFLAEWVLQGTAAEVAECGLDVLDILLVGGRDLADLICDAPD